MRRKIQKTNGADLQQTKPAGKTKEGPRPRAFEVSLEEVEPGKQRGRSELTSETTVICVLIDGRGVAERIATVSPMTAALCASLPAAEVAGLVNFFALSQRRRVAHDQRDQRPDDVARG